MNGITGCLANQLQKTLWHPTERSWLVSGEVRDGGSFETRMGGVACWNATMDENRYMVRKWNEFVAA